MKKEQKRQLDKVFSQAAKAFLKHSETDIKYRIQLLRSLRLVIISEEENITKMLAQIIGKNKTEALMTEILPVLATLQFYEKNLRKFLKPKKVKSSLAFWGIKGYENLSPSGVSLIISPWNFPFQLSMLPIISAICVGNSVILKPSEFCYEIGELCQNLCKKAGFEDNLVQSVYGKAEETSYLISQKPARIFFTGSTKVGQIIAQEAGTLLIPCLLELGGKAPFIVFKDANINQAVNAAIFGSFCNAGQVCVAASRLYVDKDIYDEFISKVIHNLSLIPPDNFGKIFKKEQAVFLQTLIDDAVLKGAKLLTGQIKNNGFKPVILSDTSIDMRVMQEEIFGPIMPIMKFNGEPEEAIKLANHSDFGLSAMVFSKNKTKAKTTAQKIKAGNININSAIKSVGMPSLAFGGVKNSGIGRYHSIDGLEFFADKTSVSKTCPFFSSDMVYFPYSTTFNDDLKQIMIWLYGSGKLSVLKLLKSSFRLLLRNFR